VFESKKIDEIYDNAEFMDEEGNIINEDEIKFWDKRNVKFKDDE
jgi:hypothetical protein